MPPSEAERMLAAATLAAGILTARPEPAAAEIRGVYEAYWDAYNIVAPDPGSPAWVEWARRKGIPIPGEDALASAAE